MTLYTTFRLLREHDACADRYRHLAAALGGENSYGDDTPIPVLRILETNGLDDALWAFRAIPPEQAEARDRMARLFACACARYTPVGDGRSAWDLMDDERSRRAVEVAERFALGIASEAELAAAWAAAWAAAGAAARAWQAEQLEAMLLWEQGNP